MHSANPGIQSLLTLGEPEVFSSSPWPDYVSQYGFTADDIPALLALIADDSIDALPQERPEVWAPVHAWRILGQLRNEAAIAPLIQSFDRLCHDDTALSELCRVIGMLGPAALPALEQHWQQQDKDEFSRVMAVDALSEIAKQHPASREHVLAIYRAYMTRPDTTTPTLNGLLMGRLLDLQATEAIGEIRQLFALNCVDLSCAGDLEEVEITLGLRTHRVTPKPNYAQLHGLGASVAGLAAGFGAGFDAEDGLDEDDPDAALDACFDLLDHYLLRYGSDAAILGVSELDGFFAGLACAPLTIMPSTWMPALWGGEAFLPEWESETELQEFSQAIFQHYNTVMGDFMAHDYAPMFLVSSIATPDLVLADDWCEGFLRGIGLWGTLSAEDAAQLEQWLIPIRHFGTAAGHVALTAMTEAEIVQLQSRIEPNVDRIRRHFFQAMKRPAPKIGRNDPCPCGSGKKHKKCCGLH